MATKSHGKKTGRRKASAGRGTVAGTASSGLRARMVTFQLGSLRGRIPEASATRVVKILRDTGVELLEPSSSPAIERRNTLSNRVNIRTSDDLDVESLQLTASQKSLAFRRAILRGALTVAQVRDELGVRSAQTIHNWIRDKKILALPDRHRQLIPRWQLDPQSRNGIVPGLDKFLNAVEWNAFGIAHWLTTRNPHLGNASPIELLKRGKLKDVLEEARGVELGQ